MVVLTFLLSMRVIPLLPRDGVLEPNMSRKLSLTGWPFALVGFGMMLDRAIVGWFFMMTEKVGAESDGECLVVLM